MATIYRKDTNNMKKLLSLIMVMCLSVSLFAGCGGEETSSDATKAPSASAPATAPATATAKPTEKATTAPSADATATPTTKPDGKEDPEVDAKLYRFYNPDKYMWDSESFISSEDEGTGLTAVGPACIYFYDEDESALCIQLTNYDPYFPIKGGEDGENFNLSEYPVFKIRLKNETCFEMFETFLMIGTGATGDDNFRFEITSEDEEYKEYIVDIGEKNGQEFLTKRDPISGVRLDALAIGEESVNDLANPSPYLFIEYFGFFKTVEDAQNWNPAHVA